MNFEEIKQVSLEDLSRMVSYQRVRAIPLELAKCREHLEDLRGFCKYPASLTQEHLRQAKEFVIKLAETCYRIRTVATMTQIKQGRRLLNKSVEVVSYMESKLKTNNAPKEDGTSLPRPLPTSIPPGGVIYRNKAR